MPTAVETLASAIRAGREASVGSGRPEAILREHVQPALAEALRERGVRASVRDEVTLAVPAAVEAAMLDAPLTSSGRADAIYNRFVIEFEPPGSLRPSLLHSATGHAVEQVQQYLRGVAVESSLALERLAGCAFDGSWIVYVQGERGGWRVSRPRSVDLDTLRALLETLESLASGRGLTAANLDEDFGRNSDSARTVVGTLMRLFVEGEASPRALAMFGQWQIDLGNASGPFAPTDASQWTQLCADLGVPADPKLAPQILFCAQTYFALVAKLVALIILEGATGEALVQALVGADDLWEGFTRLESGELTARTKALNVIEPGIFSWYLLERSSTLEDALLAMLRIADEYSAEIVEITPLVARDVLKDLYQRLLPRSIRHRLGEYYTPDWLAERVLDRVVEGRAQLRLGTRVLDPAAGSGTFLVEAISRIRANAAGRPAAEILRGVVQNVVGFDLSPLAVQASKVNYLLALAPELRGAEEPISLPVYLADSVAPPRRGGVLEGDVYVIRTSEGDWRVPTDAATPRGLSAIGELIDESLTSRMSPADVRELAKMRLPEISADDTALDRVEEIYAKTLELHNDERDGLWWRLISNAFAPTFHTGFDYVVGNPPWVSWETLPESYRRANESQWDFYELRPDALPGRRQRSGQVPLDLSMLFVARSMSHYLKDDGRLGFLITATVFKSELAGRGFRRRRAVNGRSYSFLGIEDLSRLRVFDEAANQTALLIAAWTGDTTRRVPLTKWTSIASSTIPTHFDLEHVLALTQRYDWHAEPVDPHDAASPLLTMPAEALQATLPMRRPSPYLGSVRNGIHTRGANGIFFVEILERAGRTTKVRNRPDLGRDAALPSRTAYVESDAVKTLLRGADVTRSGAAPTLGLLFFHDQDHTSQPLPDRLAQARFPLAYEFLTQFRDRLTARRRFRNFDPSGSDWLGLYSVTSAAIADHKVVVREIADGMIAAAIHDADTVADHKLYVIRCSDRSEADRVAAVLSSPVVDFLIKGFAISTSLTGSFLRYVGVRELSADSFPVGSIETLAASLGLSPEQYAAVEAVAVEAVS